MITRRIVLNFFTFVVLAVVLVVYGLVDLLNNPFAAVTQVAAILPSAGGLVKGLSVTSNGVDVGHVSNVMLVPGGVKVTMALDPGSRVPDNVRAAVTRANPLGEQSVDLVPGSGPAPPLRDGDLVPAQPGGVPPDVGQVVEVVDRLLAALPKPQLAVLLDQLAQALAGRAGDIKAIIGSSDVFSREFLAYQRQFEALLANAPPVLQTVAAAGPELRQSLANTVALTAILAQHRYDLVHLFDSGGRLADLLGPFVAAERPNVSCLLHDLAIVTANVAQPANLAHLEVALATNQEFFGPVDAATPSGPTKAVGPGTVNRNDQTWLRVMTILPPAQPPADPYNPHRGVVPTLPGAGCISDFGAGVGPATQAHPSPPVPGGKVVPAPPAEALVLGRQLYGARSGHPGTAPAVDRQPGATLALSLAGVATLAGGLGLGLLSPATRRRRSRLVWRGAGGLVGGLAGGPKVARWVAGGLPRRGGRTR